LTNVPSEAMEVYERQRVVHIMTEMEYVLSVRTVVILEGEEICRARE
jgi:hypothetical protein